MDKVIKRIAVSQSFERYVEAAICAVRGLVYRSEASVINEKREDSIRVNRHRVSDRSVV